MIAQFMCSFCFTIGQGSFLIPTSGNLYTSACLHLQNVIMLDIKLKARLCKEDTSITSLLVED